MTLTPIDPWLTSAEVDAIFKINPVALCRMRASRIGPEFRQIGRSIRYRQSAVERWVEGQIVHTKAS